MRTASVLSAATAGRPALVALRLGGAQSVVGQLSLEVALEFAGGGEGLHHELHGGQQLAGTWVAGGEVHGGERAVVDAQGEAVAVQDVEHVEDVAGATHEAEHLGDVHGVARPRVREQLAELRSLQRVKAAGGAGLLLEDDRVLDPGLVQDEVLSVGRHPLVDQVGHAPPVVVVAFDPSCQQTLSSASIGSDWICAAVRSRKVRVHWTPAALVVIRWHPQVINAPPTDDHVIVEARVRDYGFSPAQQDEIWRRWREGQSFSLIGRALGAPMQSLDSTGRRNTSFLQG